MNDRIKQFLISELNLLENLEGEEINVFMEVINDYLRNIRTREDTFMNNINSLIFYLKENGLSERECLIAIKNNPSYIHADKTELSIIFDIISIIQDSKTGEYLKKDIIINHGKFLRTGYDILYARIKHIMFLVEIGSPIMRNDFITVRKVLKITNNEFKKTYKMSKEELLENYPITSKSLAEINAWNEKYLKEAEYGEEDKSK